MNKEYNELTQKLLAAGYTAKNHPDYVEIGRCCPEKDNPLRNYEGGFVYRNQYIREKTFRTPCGLMCLGWSCMTGMYYMGQEWTFENDAALIYCPYRKYDCEMKDSKLPRESAIRDSCNVHLVNEEYRYEGSVEELKKQYGEQVEKEKQAFIDAHHGRACENHMRYDREAGQWKMRYDPAVCASFKCRGNAHVLGAKGICPILGRPLDAKRGNVYYDIKTTYRRRDLDGTLFEGQIDTCIKKGNRVFEHPVSMDICRSYVKMCQDEIQWKVEGKYSKELFFAKHYEGHEFAVEVLNIRAEQRESRDLMQDLQDIKEGIQVFHASDEEKTNKQKKSERRKKAQEKRSNKIEKKILQEGYENLERVDQNRAQKRLGLERIKELEEMRKQKEKEESEAPRQMTIEDFMKGCGES